jgi:methylglyoxal/glyoxal reductase
MEKMLLNTGLKIPAIGFGTWKLGSSAESVVGEALDAGYELIDTASVYDNEAMIGRAIRRNDRPRQEIFVTTKLSETDQGYENAIKAFEASTDRLGVDYLDLYLIHWPQSSERLESWRALEDLHSAGKVRNIGVSNYAVHHLKELLDNCKVKPCINQIEFHPFIYQQQKDIYDFCIEQGIVIEAYSPLAAAKKMNEGLIESIAKQHNKTYSQILIRWSIQRQTIPIPKAQNSNHIKQNIAVFDFEMSEEEMELLDNLSDGTRTCSDPHDIG